ncbi:phosphonopyruvate decarboxylase [Saccharothrix saharensis]|uniref:Phosphonopyruvate decarboxylase n=1 Tax=Saccharothrix saharensis TaxID=571190 RepID=A0A543J997_9PSEU|nr:phosphonopyruvate decarboxylase [Saccharothrix saharensis]TQM79391.1 phosphonopyruvate decarboxylase [Saccharothrix saharensis]
MITAEKFCDALDARGFTAASGVPCSFFGGPIALLGQTPGRYVAAANEGAALATAAGVALAGGRAYVMIQNSGLGNLVNPLTSLVMVYRIPVLTFVSLRGFPDPDDDEPQHAIMGPATAPLLDALGAPHQTLHAGDGPAEFDRLLDHALASMNQGQSPFVLVEKGSVGKVTARTPVNPDRIDSADAIRAVVALAGDSPIVATTGYTGRELFGVDDRPANFYMQGSMGHASSIALGITTTDPDQEVIVLDGDGAALMHLGTLSVIGHRRPARLIHVVLDNGIHESTGGQPTTASTTELDGVALACGYTSASRCDGVQALEQRIAAARQTPGPHLLVVPTRPRTGPMAPRATSAHTSTGIRDRFSAALAAHRTAQV